MIYERGIQFDERERKAAVERAELWTADQAARLDTTPAVILEAVTRGWVPELLEQVTSKYQLEGSPLRLEGVPDWVDQRIDRAHRAKAQIASRPTTMGLALNAAKDRAA